MTREPTPNHFLEFVKILDFLFPLLTAQNRPKKLLLFVNPYGGKKNALKIYEKYAKPLFKAADIDISLIVSQRSNQIFDLVIQQHIDQFDGIICCGGDGTFSELFNGLIYRKMTGRGDAVIDVNCIPRPDKPIGVIPAGSTDTVAYCLHGTTDVRTCVLHVILGQTGGLDISSVSNGAGLIKFFASVMSYGYLGDIAYESERLRWMGPKRYDYSGKFDF
jgi:ceramide kinase